jgi:hypothetical protein
MDNHEFLTKSANGKDVFYETVNSHAATHIADTPLLKELVIETVSKLVLEDERLMLDADMGRIIGTTDLVVNEPGDEMIYAIRRNRDVYTAFNKTQKPTPTSIVALCLERRDETSYELLSAWTGTVNSPPFPGDPNATPKSKKYWTKHSLVWGNQEILPGTETAVCPW